MNLFRRLERVLQLQGIRPHQRLVLINLAFRADEKSLTCYPSVERIAADTGMSRRGVQYVIAELQRQGLITVLSSGRGKGRNAPNQYRLVFLEMAHPVRNSTDAKWRRSGQQIAQDTIVNSAPGSHEPLDPKETVAARLSDGAPALGARAPRRPRPSEPGESREAKEKRQLLEIALQCNWPKMKDENDREFLSRIRRLNEKRVVDLT